MTPDKHAPLVCYYAQFGRSRSNGTSVQTVIRREKMSLSRPAFQGHSRSLEPTWIDQLPIVSY